MSEKNPLGSYETDIEAMLQDRELVDQCFRKVARAFVAARGNAQHVRDFAGCDHDYSLQTLAEGWVRARLTFPFLVTIDEPSCPISAFQEEEWWGRAGIRRDALRFMDDEGIRTTSGEAIQVGIMRCSKYAYLAVEEMAKRRVRPLSVGEQCAFQRQHPQQAYLVAALGSTVTVNGDPYTAYHSRTGKLFLWQRDKQDERMTFTVVADPHGRWKPWKDLRPPPRLGGF